MLRRHLPLLVLIVPVLTALGCDPLAPVAPPTAQVIIVTAEPSVTPVPSLTPTITQTPVPTPTEVPITPTATAFPCDEDGGQYLDFDDFVSEDAGEIIRYRVFVPPCYFETVKRYPTLYLLHGAGETQEQWEELGLSEVLNQGWRSGVLAQMLVVMPYTGSIGTFNQFPPDPSYETVIVDELVQRIDRDFCTWSDRDHRAIGGISRGGFWAYSIALRNLDVFGVIGGHSAFFDPDIAPPTNDPLALAENSAFLEEVELRMYIDNGAADPVGENLERFSATLSSRGIEHTYIINPVGDHSNDYWSSHLSEYLAFYARDWSRTLADLPDCTDPSP